MKDKKGQKGFTLVELMVVVVIIGILAAIAIPMYSNYTTKAKKKAAAGDLKGLSSVMETYYAENQTVPTGTDPTGAIEDWAAKYSDSYAYSASGAHDYWFTTATQVGGVYVYIDETGKTFENATKPF